MDAGNNTVPGRGSWLLPLLISSFMAGVFVALAAGGTFLGPYSDGCEVAVNRMGASMDKRWESVLDALVTAQRGREADVERVVALCVELMGGDPDGGCSSLRDVDPNLGPERKRR